MPVLKKPFTFFILVSLGFTIIALAFGGQKAFAVSCSKIEDLDDRAKCYEDKIEDKQDDYESTSKKLSDVRSKKDSISSKISQYASELNVTQEEMNELQSDIDEVVEDLGLINQKLVETKDKLSEKIKLRNHIVRNYSKRTILNDLEMFFSSVPVGNNMNGFQFTTLAQAFNKSIGEEAINLIGMLNTEIKAYESDKKETEEIKGQLETEQGKLVALKADLDNKRASAQNEFKVLGDQEKGFEQSLASLQEEIDDLSSKQQEILKLKYGDENGTVGNYDSPSSKTPDPPFKPAFAAFSYGAYTHYKGMSQYGAKGRADDGDDYKDIIEFYYKKGVDEKDDFPSKICVEGQGEMSFQKYLYGIAEMPSDWPEDALKAQAIAARSYAYRYQKQGKCICTTQSCQVFLKSKSDNPPSRWKDAVDDTEDMIVKDDVVTYYSSTTGGYIDNVGWDTDGSWPGNAYEKKAGSPWFYKAWYTKSYNNSDSCGHNHPWLTESEMADILNSLVVWQNGSGSDKDHVSPVTTSCWGGDPYSLGEMKEKADDLGTAYNKVTNVDVEISNGGYTSKVILTTDKGTVNVSGDVFKTVFNLRAPGFLSIKSKLFDLEKRN